MVDLKSKLHRDQRRMVLTDPKGKSYAVRTPNELWDLMWSLTTDPAFKTSTAVALRSSEPARSSEPVEAEYIPPGEEPRGTMAPARRTPVQSIATPADGQGQWHGHRANGPQDRRGHEQVIGGYDGVLGDGRSAEDVVTDAVLDGGIRAAQSIAKGISRLSFRGKTRRKGKAKEIERKIREQRNARLRGEG